MKLARFLFVGAALVVVTVAVAVVRSQEGPPTKIGGLPADWKSEKEIPAIDGGSIQIPAMKLTVWVEQGWVVARLETEAGDLEWHVVLARATDAQPPKVHVDPKFGCPSVEYGAYFVRENFGHLRIMRERKHDKSPAWIMPDADPKQTQRCMVLNRTFVQAAGDWCWLTSGPSKNKPDVRIRFQHKDLGKKGYGGTGIQGSGGLGHVFYGDATCQDEGDLLIANRMPSFVAALILQAQKLKKEMGDKPAPALAAKQWLNTAGELGLDQFKGKVVLLDFWGQWCAPCVKNLPSVEELHVKYKDKGLVVIGVHSADQSEKLEDFLKEKKVTFPVMIDQGTTAKRYVIQAWPTYFLIDKAGKVSWGFANDLPSNTQIEELLRK
jgi:thiol-disulfide isomerase/thioredoxin